MSKDIAKLAMFESQKDVRLTYEIRRRRERLRPRNQRDRDRRAAESAQQREARRLVTRRRVRDHRVHRASRSAAQRERVLGHRKGRLASETPDQRTSRLELGRA